MFDVLYCRLVTEFQDCFWATLPMECSAEDMQKVETLFGNMLNQFHIAVDYVCREHVDGNTCVFLEN